MAWSGARDGYEAYLAEKLWELIPGLYKELDGLQENAGVLRGFIEIIAEQAAHLRRSHDRLWEDQQIELASEWAVPYLGALVATRILPAQTPRGRRIDVAKTIYYRRRKGTPAILEQLAADVAGWEGVVSEGFRRLVRAPHWLDTPSEAAQWPGTFSTEVVLGAELAGGPFSTFQHTADVRRPRGTDGRFGISRVAMHLYRLRSVRLTGVRPRPSGVEPDTYTLCPSGRDRPLFQARSRVDSAGDPLDWDGWRPAHPWDVPAPLACRFLGHEIIELSERHVLLLIADGVLTPPVADQLRPFRGVRFEGLGKLRGALLSRPDGATLTTAAAIDAIRERALIEECGKARLLGSSVRIEIDGAPAATREFTSAGSLANWADPRHTRGLIIDPERGRLRFVAPPAAGLLTVDVHLGETDAIGAGGFARGEPQPAAPDETVAGGAAITAARLPRDGSLRVADSATYAQPNDRTGVENLRIHAGPQERPYVRLRQDWTLSAAAAGNASLLIDGLWVGAGAPHALVLAGDWEEVRLVNVTLDPGGALTADAGSAELAPVTLLVAGRVERLVVERSILGPIRRVGRGVWEEIVVEDSIIQARAGRSIDASQAEVHTTRTTLIGDVVCNVLHASETLVDGTPLPRNSQAGCFRFSAARTGGQPPKPYRSHFYAPRVGFFASRRFGDPHFVRLRQSAPDGVRLGAEGGGEIGAFAALMEHARAEGLRRKVEEYLPFGLLPVFVFET